jgi:hypothetical protein
MIVVIALKYEIRNLYAKRNDASPTHRTWCREELVKTMNALREVRQIGVKIS